MPIGYSSPARNLFLLGSSGAQVVTNFFKQIDQASSGDFFHTPSEIRYTESDEKFILAGEADKTSPASEKYGWIEKRQQDGTQDWEVQVSSLVGDNTSLQALELDGSNLVAVGKTGSIPWIAKYTDGGVITWQSTTNSGDVEYTGVAVDSNSNYYACGNTDYLSSSDHGQAFVEKYDSSGNPGWGKSAFMLGRDVVLNDIAVNDRGHVVAVGYLEDDSQDKGYIVKIDTTTGDIMWDRTLELSSINSPTPGDPVDIKITATDIDNTDHIYVVGNIDPAPPFGSGTTPHEAFIVKYSPEGNILWQSMTDKDAGTMNGVYYNDITVDNTTKKATVIGRTDKDNIGGQDGVLLTRYNSDGSLSWRREVQEDTFNFRAANASGDGDQSFIYLIFNDDNDSETYVYGKVSATGNGLGDFEYNDGTGTPLLDYITTSGPNGSGIGEKIGRLSDGSVRNDTSDLMTYPFTANKIVFDDLATQVTNKRRQMDSADSFEYSGSPAIRIADFTELDLGDESFDVTVPADEAVYEEAGTYTFTVPAGVTEVSAVVVGSGGGAASSPGADAQSGGGGGGGGLAYGTFTVTPGEDLTIVVGNFGVGGASGTTAGTAGESTTISRGATVLLEGGGGAGGQADAPTGNSTTGTTASGGSSSGTERDGGGSGGSGGPSRGNFGGGGGGGAGGYNGAGGNAGSGNSEVGTGGSGGGGGGGGGQSATGTQNNGGGGVGLFGGPINGAGGANGNPGGGGSNGQGGQPGGKGGKFGGGGGGAEDDTNLPGGDGGTGGARIIWGAGRSFPNSAAQDFSSVETRVTDKSGKGNNGAIVGATLNAAGYWEFDGVGNYINLPKTTALANWYAGPYSIEMWFRADNLNLNSNLKGPLIGLSDVDGNGEWWSLGWNNSSVFNFYYWNGSQQNVSGSTTLSTATWYHAVLTHDSGTITLYLNGSQDGTASVVGTPQFDLGSQYDLTVGASASGYHDGQIGEVRVYPRVLTAAQVFQNYNATKSKYINEAPDTAPKIGPGIVYDNNLLLNYDFGNGATYDRAENLSAYSEDFTLNNVSTGWRTDAPQYSRATLIANTGIDSPVGTNNASRWQSGNNNNQELIYHLVPTALTVGKTYTASCWIRRVESFGPVRFYIGDNAAQDVTTQLDAVPFGTWVRCSATYTVTGANGTPIRNYISVFPNGNVDGGDKTTIDIWGMNVNEGSTPGRYVKTYGSAITAPTTVKNLSSSSYPSTISGAEFNSDGYFVFDNANNDEIISSQTTVADTGMPGMTLEIWANLSNSTVFGTGGNAWLFGEEGRYRLIYTGTQINWVCSTVNNGWYTTGTAITADSLSILDSWHHIVGVYDGTNIRLDLDGTTIVTSTSAISGSVSSSGDPLMSLMGTDAANVGWGTGSIGQVRIYNRGLTATEVSQNFNATRGKYGV